MAYSPRTPAVPGGLILSADQNQSILNEAELYRLANGPYPPGPTGGIIRAFMTKTGLVDNTITTWATITTTNEAGSNDGGVYGFWIDAIGCHGIGPTLETSLVPQTLIGSKAINGAGSAGALGSGSTTAGGVAASTAATKTVTTMTLSAAEASEYITNLRVQIDLAGTTVTTGDLYAWVTIIYAGFTTAPVLAAA